MCTYLHWWWKIPVFFFFFLFGQKQTNQNSRSMEYVLLPAIQLGIPGKTPLGLALADSSFLFWKAESHTKLLVIGRRSNMLLTNNFKANSMTKYWLHNVPFMLNHRTVAKIKDRDLFLLYTADYGELLYLRQLPPEETTSRLLTVNCPGLYPKVLHVEGHRWEDGLASRKPQQFSF